ncbi:MAG: hypothetical protein US67_C0075G0005 [Candidatus Woesebacteria bacterium GW2011_GWD1_38_10]|uniref:Transposase IS200-like domain-containing protein n=1 Tax=Candidatus Woesebacteria bacterium GW2011_GWD1_38_10 TaxID=1618592 RepID=A0A0G0KBW9_9BACT|nr:MAG: hypothetical protein US67_C0075G0005 [Candidatus Woesebacteria bacterium GW2011_GWD1_38_10]
MPPRNIIKVYSQDGYYHIYNRGVGKRRIFKEKSDYLTFLSFLKEALSEPVDPDLLKETFTLQGCSFQGVPHQPKNFHNKLYLLAFCLMPNHFHLLVRQINPTIITEFMRSLATRYSMYFNKRYNRVGSLFQNIFKAIQILDDNYLLHLSRYIHLNPQKNYKDLTRAYSSYADYLHLRNTEWVKTDIILNYFENKVSPEFKKFNSYKKFVEGYKTPPEDNLGKLLLDE